MDVGYSEVAGARPAYLNQLPEESGATVDLTLIESMADGLRTRDGKEDRVGVGIDSLYKSLTISAQKVVEKLKESDGTETLSAFPKDDYLPMLRSDSKGHLLNPWAFAKES